MPASNWIARHRVLCMCVCTESASNKDYVVRRIFTSLEQIVFFFVGFIWCQRMNMLKCFIDTASRSTTSSSSIRWSVCFVKRVPTTVFCNWLSWTTCCARHHLWRQKGISDSWIGYRTSYTQHNGKHFFFSLSHSHSCTHAFQLMYDLFVITTFKPHICFLLCAQTMRIKSILSTIAMVIDWMKSVSPSLWWFAMRLYVCMCVCVDKILLSLII